MRGEQRAIVAKNRLHLDPPLGGKLDARHALHRALEQDQLVFERGLGS